jgi:hypothetical protein
MIERTLNIPDQERKKETEVASSQNHAPTIVVAKSITAHPTPAVVIRPDAPFNVVGDAAAGPGLVD